MLNPYVSVIAGAFRYYDFQVSHAEDLDLTLTTLSGQSTILVSTKQYPELESTSFEWYSADFLGSVKNIKIAATDPKACRDDTCRYYVAVYGYTNSSYSLVMGGSSSSTVLQNGVPMTGSVAIKGWTYYNYKVDIEHHDLTISVTPITGDADVYVSTTNQRPNMTNFDERSIRFGQDSIDLKDVKTGMYYIGVNAIMSNATYTITCLLTNKDQNDGGNVYKLVDGMPQHSTVDEGQYQYYQIDLSSLSKAAQKKSVTFSLTREYGNPDLYITTALPLPSTTHFEEISMTDDYDVININGPKPTVYYLAVYGRTDASFTVTASTADVITTLQDGRPVRGFLEAGGINHYHYTLGEDYGKKDITINLTPFSGDPDLYITTSEFGSLPNKTNYQWNAVSYRDDSITISHADENACKTVGCTYFVGVSSYTPSSFTVTAVLQDVVMLEDGVPQTGSVEKHAFRYYRLEGSQKNTNHKDITFTVTPMSGNPNIYIGKGDGSYPTLTSYSAHTSSFWNGASLTLKAGDEGYCSDGTDDCAYIIGVYGSSASSFSISVTTSSQSRTLLNGVPVQEDVGADGWEYFTFDVDQQGMNVVFSLTPITGDPDLFVSDKFTHPNDTNANAKSQAAGADAVTITHSKKKRYYVGVHAWSNTTFTLTAYMMSPNSTDSEHAVMLVSGVPQHTILAQDMDQYYHFFIDEGTAKAAKAVTVALTRKVGDPDFYVGKGFKPSADKYDYKSEAFGSDIITIGDLKAGDYFVKVHAASTCDFTLMYSNDVGTTTLQDGVAQTAVLEASAYQYFSFNLEHIDDDTYFTVIVTSFHGDPDLYISSKYQRPNVTHHDYAARAYLADSITIPHKLLKLTTYYIGVSAFTPCTFTVIASTRRQLQLQDGVPQTGDVKHEESKLYKLTSATDKEAKTLTFTVTPFSGSAYMYISTSEHGTPVVTDSTSYVWASNEYMTSQTIVIQKNDENACRKAGCEYIALVYGRSPSNYTIVASSSHSTTRLQDGIAQRAMVAEGTYEYFIFELTNPKAELSFTTTPITGDPDLFVSATVTHPTREEATWRGMSFGGDAVHIDYTDKDYIVGTYYVSVFAWANTTFTIMASVADLSNADDSNSDDIVPYDHPLINGVPQTGILQDKTSKAYYAITVPASTDVESLTLTISASVGDPDVFVTIDGSLPSRTNNQYKSDNWGRDTLVVPMLECKGEICLPTAVRISVEGDQHTLYTISATTSKGATTLIAGGQPIMVTLTENESRYFKMYVDAKAPGLTITATALSGDCDMFVSMENQYPTRLDSDWSSMKAGSDTVFIANPKAGTYFIGLDAFSASSFTLSATIGATKLSSGIPQHGEMNGFNDLREYSFTLYDENKVRLAEKIQDVVITVTPVGNGDVDMFVSNGTTPTRHDYMWSTIDGGSNDQGDDTFSVRRNEITLRRHEHDVYDKDVVAHPPCFSGCTYYVVLSAYTHVQYTITVTTNDVSKLLEAGKPTSNFVSAGEYTYYRAIIDNDDNDINIVSTNFVGEIDLYVTVCADDNNDGCITKPTTDQHTWFSGEEDTVEGDHIGISHELDTNYRKGMYFIGVYGVSDSHFSITLSTSNTMIQDGIPTVAHTSSVEGEGVFFFYDYDVPDDFISDIEFHLSSIGRDDGPNDDGGHARRRLADGYQYEYDLYVSTKSNSTKPSKDDYEFHQRVKAGEALIIPQTFTIKCRSCVYFLGVYGVPNQMFRLRVTNDDSVLTLIDKQSTQGNVEFNRFNYYEMYVPDASEFSVKLETCKGNADLYIAQDTYKPSLTQYGWKSANKLDIDETDIKDPSISQSSFYIGVYGHEDSDYHLTAITKKSSDPSPETQLQIFHPSGGPPTEAQVRAYQTGDHDESMPTASQYKRGDGIVLVFPLAWDAGSAADRDTSLRYTVYYAEMRENLVLYTACGLQRAVAVEALTFTNGDIRDGKLGAFVHDRNGARELMVEIPNLASGEWYKFNVMVESASDSSASRTGDQYLIYKDAYNVQVAQPDSSDYPGGEDGGSGISFTTVMTVAIPMLVVVSVIIAVLVYRNKMLTQELQIEMHDLPKQAMRKATRGMGGASGQRGGRNNYNHLLDMDSGMDSLGDYMAPGV